MAAGNTTQISVCPDIGGACNPFASAMLVTINVVSVIVNLIHIVILKTMPCLAKQRYFWILIGITSVDVFVSISYAFGVSCTMYDLQLSADSIAGSALILIGKDSSSPCRYSVLTLASLDRFYAICRPFDYSTSRLINNIGKLLLLTALINVIIASAKVLVLPDGICLSAMFGPVFGSSAGSMIYLNVLTSLIMALAGIITAALLVKVGVELRRMQKRSGLTDADKELKQASKYVIGTCIMFYSTVIPHFLFGLSFTFQKNKSASVVAIVPTTLLSLQSFYGIANVIFYAYLNPGYVKKVRYFLKRLRNAVKVSPSDNE